jgi:hypothetical protein
MLPICQILPKNICLGRRSGQRKVSRGAFCTWRKVTLLKGPNTPESTMSEIFFEAAQEFFVKKYNFNHVCGLSLKIALLILVSYKPKQKKCMSLN